MAWVCPFHEWAIMRAVNKKTRSLETERGWLDYCRDRGYDALATTWEGAIRKLAKPIVMKGIGNHANNL